MVSEYKDEDVERQKRKDQIAARIQKRNTRIFLVVGTIIQTIETFVIVIALFCAVFAVLTRVLPEEPTDFSQKLCTAFGIISLIAGLALGMKLYYVIVRFAVKKFDLKDKIDPKVLERYAKIPKQDKK